MVNFFNFLEMGNLYTFCLSSRLWGCALADPVFYGCIAFIYFIVVNLFADVQPFFPSVTHW